MLCHGAVKINSVRKVFVWMPFRPSRLTIKKIKETWDSFWINHMHHQCWYDTTDGQTAYLQSLVNKGDRCLRFLCVCKYVVFLLTSLQARLSHKVVICWCICDLTNIYIYVMSLNQRSVTADSTLYPCWVLFLHHVTSSSDGADAKYSILEVGAAKFDPEFNRTSLKRMGLIGSGDGAWKLQCWVSY